MQRNRSRSQPRPQGSLRPPEQERQGPARPAEPSGPRSVPEALRAAIRWRADPFTPKGPIFVGKGGEPLLGPRHWFDDAVRKAGIVRFTWHDVRHSFASRLVMAGVDIRTVAELMGHRKIEMTMRYAHLAPVHKLLAIERLTAYNF